MRIRELLINSHIRNLLISIYSKISIDLYVLEKEKRRIS